MIAELLNKENENYEKGVAGQNEDRETDDMLNDLSHDKGVDMSSVNYISDKEEICLEIAKRKVRISSGKRSINLQKK